MPDQEAGDAAEQARRGVRDWVRAGARRAGQGLRGATPYGVLAFLAGSALAPIAASGFGVGGLLGATLDQLGQVGGGYLADVLGETARRAGGRSRDEQLLREALGQELLARLTADDDDGRSAALGAEIGRLLQAVDAVEVALAAAAETDASVRDELAAAFHALGTDVGALQWMVTDVRRSLGALRWELAQRSHEQRVEMERVRRQLITITQLTSQVGRPDRPADTTPATTPDTAAARDAAAGRADDVDGAATHDAGGAGLACPYPGLAAFEPEDAPWFHGREEQVAEILGRLAEQAMGGPPLVLTGVSGVGKSSLLRAGVLPAVAVGALGDARQWPWLLLTPGAQPLDELVARTLVAVGRPAADVAAAQAAVRAAPESFGSVCLPAETGVRPVIVVDQFEELFTQCADVSGRLAFGTALANAAPAVVLIAVRADFYPDCAELPALAGALAAGHQVLGRLDADQLRRAVVAPATRAGLEIESGLVELLLADLGARTPTGYDPGALPLLGHALRATWSRRDGRRLTVAGYRATGGIHRAVAETAERIYLDLDVAGRDRLRAALLRLVTVTDSAVVVRRRGDRQLFDPELLTRLVQGRLVTVTADSVQISHEALLDNWPRLVGWLAEDRDQLLLRQRLAAAAEDWHAGGRDPDQLLRGARLATVRDRADLAGLTPVETAYLDASVAAAHAAEVARQRAVRRLRRLVVGLAAALLLAVVGGVVAVGQQQAAEQQRRQATSRQYAAEALTALTADDDLLAVRKSLDAWQQAPTTEAYGALISAQAVRTIGTLGTGVGGSATAVSPDGSTVAVGQPDGRTHLWDVATLRQRDIELRDPRGATVMSLAFAPDGRRLVTGALHLTEGVRIWDTSTGELLRTVPAFGAVAWSPDGSTVIASRSDPALSPQVQVAGWSAETGALRWSLPTGTFGYELALSADGQLLAVADPTDDRTQVWRLADRTRLRDLPAAFHVAFAPDDALVLGTVDGGLQVWTLDGQQVELSTAPDRAPIPIAVTPDGILLTPGGWQAGRIDTWALSTQLVATGYSGYAGRVISDLAVSADGRTVAVTGQDAPTVLFRRGGPVLPHPEAVQYLVVDPSADRIVTAAGDGAVRSWDLATRTVQRTIGAPAGVNGLAIASDGTIAVSTAGGTVYRYTAAGTSLPELSVPLAAGARVHSPAYSPDGRLLAVAVDEPEDPDDTGRERDGVLVWRLDDAGAPTYLPTGGEVSVLRFTADGAALLAAVDFAAASGADLTTGTQLRSWRAADLSPADRVAIADRQLTGLAVTRVGDLVAVARSNGQVELRAAAGLQLVRVIQTPTSGLSGVAFSPDGDLLVTTAYSDDLLRLWAADTGRPVAVLVGHVNDVNEIGFTRDGHLVSGSLDATAQVWDLDAERVARRLCGGAVPAARTVGATPPQWCG
ncbi:hypothetical protein O7623_31040 [Solwaraspora sp. WMMD791]|uniref:NACHT and WD repeat domain-containing protein n=1 Tax=Solwaraspora sp. WMMD791 TaxID=3016086 RepID=UPI00249BE36A|nr:hypothetical protein [Solwaraspora sp. WMMD791]WFE27596.1 hypothetical protein O7623_31040 [Solwaraspora sp. WMMD791]